MQQVVWSIFAIFLLLASGCITEVPDDSPPLPYNEAGTYVLYFQDEQIAVVDLQIHQPNHFTFNATVQLLPRTVVYYGAPTVETAGRTYTISGLIDSSTGELLEVIQDPLSLDGSSGNETFGFSVPITEPTIRKYHSFDRWIPHADDLHPFSATWGTDGRTLTRDIIPIGLQIPVLRDGEGNFTGIQVSSANTSEGLKITWRAPCDRECSPIDLSIPSERQGEMLVDKGLLPVRMDWNLTSSSLNASLVRTSHSLVGASEMGQAKSPGTYTMNGSSNCGILSCNGPDWPASWGFEAAWNLVQSNPVHIAWMAIHDPQPHLQYALIDDNDLGLRRIVIIYQAIDRTEMSYEFFVGLPGEADILIPGRITPREGFQCEACRPWGVSPDHPVYSLSELMVLWADAGIPSDAVLSRVEFQNWDPAYFPDPIYQYQLTLDFEWNGQEYWVEGSPSTGMWRNANVPLK